MDSPLDKVSRDAKGSVRLAFVAMAPLPRGLPIHEGHALLDPVEQEGAGALVAVVGRGEDHAIAGERLMAVLEHEEMFRAGQQSFVIDVAMMAFVEPVVDVVISPPTMCCRDLNEPSISATVTVRSLALMTMTRM